jgi:hypothetical protein
MFMMEMKEKVFKKTSFGVLSGADITAMRRMAFACSEDGGRAQNADP